MGFSSEAVASWTSVQWALPLIVAAKRSLYHVHYFRKGCADHFSNLIRRRHLPPAPQPIKVSQLRAQSRVCCFLWGTRTFALSPIIGTNRISILLWIFCTFEVAKRRCFRMEHVGKTVIMILHVRMLIARADVAAVLIFTEIWNMKSKTSHIQLSRVRYFTASFIPLVPSS